MRNPNKTSPLDSFYNDYAEIIRIKGCRYSTVYDFLVCSNLKLIIEARNISINDIAKATDINSTYIISSLNLQSRFTSCQVYKIAQYLNVAMSELYKDRTEFHKEIPEFRF